MTAQEKKMDEKLMKDFQQRMIGIQDLARGLPEERVTEIETAARSIEKAFLESSPSVKKAIESAQETQDKAISDIEEIDRTYYRYRTEGEKIKGVLTTAAAKVCVCTPRNFVLPFINGVADPSFGTESPITNVEQGIVGWGDHSNPPPKISNTGSGNGQTINGNLNLCWRKTVPHDGIFAMRPNQGRTSFPVYGSHKVRGRGWWLSSNDSRVEVHAWVIVYLDFQWLYDSHNVVSWDATKSENRTKHFGKWIDLPGRITFQAQAGQKMGMTVLLYGYTWANDEGLAELNVSTFGLPSNWIQDMDIDVID